MFEFYIYSIYSQNLFFKVRKKGGKSDSMRFSSEFAREIVTEALRFQNRFASDRADQKPVNLLFLSLNFSRFSLGEVLKFYL